MKTTVSVTLHPNKVYIQHYTKGVKFIGSVIKPNRIYVGNRLKGNASKAFKEISEDIEKGHTSKEDILHYRCSINSYLGFMRHRASYNVRKKLFRSEYYRSIENYLIPCNHYSMVTRWQNELSTKFIISDRYTLKALFNFQLLHE